MHIILWEYHVKTGRQLEFESVYTADGEWAQLFRRSPGFLGTELLHDDQTPHRYLTIDRWETSRAFRDFLDRHREEYDAMDTRCAVFFEDEFLLGEFEGLLKPGS